MGMVERVARRIYEAEHGHPCDENVSAFAALGQEDTIIRRRWESCAHLAKAAIRAMREPTGAMAESGGKAHSGNDYFDSDDFPKEAAEIYRAMIDAALG
jgi:hypothetical protein